jgi:hypothetical protein
MTRAEDICGILNDYFATVFTDEAIGIKLPEVEQVFKGDQHNELSDIEITGQ